MKKHVSKSKVALVFRTRVKIDVDTLTVAIYAKAMF